MKVILSMHLLKKLMLTAFCVGLLSGCKTIYREETTYSEVSPPPQTVYVQTQSVKSRQEAPTTVHYSNVQPDTPSFATTKAAPPASY